MASQTRMTEDFQAVMNQRLAEQQKELQNIFALEKQDLLQQYESRKNYMELQHQQKIQQVLAGRLEWLLCTCNLWWVQVLSSWGSTKLSPKAILGRSLNENA